MTTMTDRDATLGNNRIRRAEFIREEMRQTGCLASEAALAWDLAQRRLTGEELPASRSPRPIVRPDATTELRGIIADHVLVDPEAQK